MECPNCRYVTTPGQASVEGSCPKCGHQPERDQPSPTTTDFQAFGMPDPGQDDGNQGNPLAEGTIMGSDGERPALKRDNWMSKRTEVFLPLGFTAKDDGDDEDEDEKYIPASEVEVIKEEDLPDKRKDRDLDSVEAAFGDENDAGNTTIPAEADNGDSLEHADGDRALGLQVGDDVGGSPDQGWSDHTAQQISDRLPQILQHAFSEEPTGDLEDLHQLLSSERPGYDQQEDDEGAMQFLVAGMGGDPQDPGEWEEGEHNGYDPMDETPHDEAVTSAIIIEANVFGAIGGFMKNHALDIASIGAMAIPGVGEAALAARAGLAAAKGAKAIGGIGKLMGAARSAGGLAAKAWNSPALKWPKRLMAANHLINGSPGLLGGGGGMGQQQQQMQPAQVNAPSYYSHHEILAQEHRFALMQPGLTPPGQTTLTPEDVEEQAQSFQGRCPSCGATISPGQPCPQCGMGQGSMLGTDPSQLTAAFFGPGKSVNEGIPEPPSTSQLQTGDIPPDMTIQEWNKQGRPVHCDSCQNPTVDRQSGKCSSCGTLKPGYEPLPEYERTGAATQRYAANKCPECGRSPDTGQGSGKYKCIMGHKWDSLEDAYDADSTEHPLGPHTGADTQGPNTDEQKAAVAELLQKENRADEIPQMILQPEQYADELSKVIGEQPPPDPVDPSQQTPPPAVDPAAMQGQGMPPGMPPMGPGGGAPMGAMARAVNKYATEDAFPVHGTPWCSMCYGTGMNYKTERGPDGQPPVCPQCNGSALEPQADLAFLPEAEHPLGPHTGAEVQPWEDWGENHMPPQSGTGVVQTGGRCTQCGSENMISPLGACRDCGFQVQPGGDGGTESWDGRHAPETDSFIGAPYTGLPPGANDGSYAPKPRTLGPIHQGSDHVQEHGDNFDNELDVNAADRVRPEDHEQEQDSSHSWADQSGEPLVEGQEYEMYSNKFDIPDMIRIEAVKPDSLQFALTGEYGLDHSTEIKREEAQLEDLAFVPVASVHPEDAPPEEGQQNAEDLGLADPGAEQSDLSTPSNDGFNQPLLSHTAAMSAQDFRFLAETIASAPVAERQALAEHFAEGLLNTNPRFDKERFIQAAIGQPGGRDVRNVDRDYPPDNQPGDLVVPPEWTANTNREWLKEGGASFTPVEQRAFIEEEGVARNQDKLDLSNTHYESNVEQDDYFLFGL